MANGTITSRMPYEAYAKIDSVSITRLKQIQRSPLHYAHFLKHGLPETDALRLGIAAHTATLEPDRFQSQFAVWARRGPSGSLCPRNGQYWQAFLEANIGKHVITEDDEINAREISNAVRSDPVASKYLTEGDPEVSMQWECWVESTMGRARMVPCRGRIDWITSIGTDTYLVGLKTSRDIRPALFGSASYKLGYHMQWAFYHDAYVEIRGVKPILKEIVVESSPPHDVAVYRISDDVISQGREDYMTLLRTWVECTYDGLWHGVANGNELELTMPTYAYPQEEDISTLELEQ